MSLIKMSKTLLYTSGEYLESHPTWHVEDSQWKAKQVIKMIKNHNIQVDSVCEIGCGVGEILRQLYLHLPDNIIFSGYEVSPQAFEQCQSRKQNRLNFHLKNILQEDVFFDIGLCLDVFEHVPDYLNFLTAIRTKSKYKIFHIPLDISVSSVIRGNILLQSWQKNGHIHFFDKETALAALEDSGYKIIDYFYTPYYVEATNKSLKSNLMALPRKIFYSISPDFTARMLGGYPLLVLAQ
jgi:2-polyprenyl-3-methyl-5-hydroxy-6-metoxy-1,4-benzoquinol methylase